MMDALRNSVQLYGSYVIAIRTLICKFVSSSGFDLERISMFMYDSTDDSDQSAGRRIALN